MSESHTNESRQTPQEPPVRPPRRRFRSLLIGVLLLSGLVLAVTHLGDIARFGQLVQHAEPTWLLAGLCFQIMTYVCAAAVWQQTLRRADVRYSVLSLVPLAFGKLFSDQALPSSGMSGTGFIVAALRRRGIPSEICMAAFLVGLVTYYTAYLGVVLTSVALLWFHHAIRGWIVAAVAVFCLVAVAIPTGALWLQRRARGVLPGLFARIPGLGQLLQTYGKAPVHLLRTPSLVAKVVLLQTAVFVLDAATLWAMLRAIGHESSFLVAFPSFVVASIVAILGPVPLGIGTFEASCVAMLGALGVGVEAALTATLLLRGFTLWLPMLPGMWIAKRELR